MLMDSGLAREDPASFILNSIFKSGHIALLRYRGCGLIAGNTRGDFIVAINCRIWNG